MAFDNNKTLIFRLMVLWAYLLMPFISFAQLPGMGIVEPVKWTHSVQRIDDSTAVLRIRAEIEDGWHLYSQYQKGTGLPLVFSFDKSDAYVAITGDTLLESPHYTEHYDSFLKETEFYLSNNASFDKKIGIISRKGFEIYAKAEGQACRDGACVPVSSNFVFKLDGRKTPVKQVSQAQNVKTVVEEKSESTEAAAAMLDSAGVADTEATVTESSEEVGQSSVSEPAKDEESLLWFFLLSFGGGIVALLTPCVLPIIPMTVSYFMKNGGIKRAVFYGLSIIFIFLLFGLLFAVLFGQDAANFISTHWLPNIIFAVIFVVFAFSLFGYYELSLPSKWVNKSAAGSDKAGYAGTFFMALTLVLVSFSCTLPIAGTIVLNAAAGGFIKPLVGMLGFSLAFALPFTAFALFPAALSKLPKSGSWMNTLKVCLAFVELAFALKFFSVPDQTYHWGLLDREIYLAIWIVLFGMLGMYLLGKLRFPNDIEMPVQKSLLRFVLAICCFSFTVYMIPGLFGAPLNGISGWLPPMQSQDFKINQASLLPSVQDRNFPQVSFGDDLHAVSGINAFFDYDEAMAYAKKQDKPLLLDFSGHGCVNCRKVEQVVLSDARVQEVLSEYFVVATLYVDDKVLELPDKLQITDKSGEKIKMLGEKNMYIQNTIYGQNSQPCYIVVNPKDGKPLVPPMYYELNPAKFMEFLSSALAEFK